MSFRMGLVLLYSSTFCLLEKFLISPSHLKDIFAGHSIKPEDFSLVEL